MNISVKNGLLALSLLFGMVLSTPGMAQSSSCCTQGKDAAAKKACCSSAAVKGATSGCTPSACRGAKTKFGEAKVISELRLSLVELKAHMEQSTEPKFDERSYDIHGIVGDTDSESLDIIAREVRLIEQSFIEKMDYQTDAFDLPENKAKQVQYLNTRIDDLKKMIEAT